MHFHTRILDKVRGRASSPPSVAAPPLERYDFMTTAVPPHVRPEQVYCFDIYQDQRLLADLHLGYRALQLAAPEIFYTPLNGGHWMVTRYDLVEAVLRNTEVFSNQEIEIPKTGSHFVATSRFMKNPSYFGST